MEHMGSANIHPIERKESFQIHEIFTKNNIVNHFYTKYKVGYIYLYLDIDQLKLYTNFVSQTMLDWQS